LRVELTHVKIVAEGQYDKDVVMMMMIMMMMTVMTKCCYGN